MTIRAVPFRRIPRRRRPAPSLAAPCVLLLAALLPGGCAAAIGAGAIAATGKNPVDQIYSLASGKDCSLARKQRGLTYCVEDEAVIEAAVHCYPTLGDSTCYRAADPYPGAQREMGLPPAPAGAGAPGVPLSPKPATPNPTPPKTN